MRLLISVLRSFAVTKEVLTISFDPRDVLQNRLKQNHHVELISDLLHVAAIDAAAPLGSS
jgi:hypothetical protein